MEKSAVVQLTGDIAFSRAGGDAVGGQVRVKLGRLWVGAWQRGVTNLPWGREIGELLMHELRQIGRCSLVCRQNLSVSGTHLTP